MFIIGWVAVLGLAGGLAVAGGGTFSTSMSIDGTEAQNTIDSLSKNFPDASRGSGQVIFHKTNGLAFTETEQSAIVASLEQVVDFEGVDDVIDPFKTQGKLDKRKEKLVDAPDKLEKAQIKIDDGKTKIAKGWKKIARGERKLAQGEKDLVSNEKKLRAAIPRLNAKEHTLSNQRLQLKKAIKQLVDSGAPDNQIDPLRENLQRLEAGLAALNNGKHKVQAGIQKIAQAWDKISDGQEGLADGKKELTRAERKLTRGQEKLDEAKSKIAAGETLVNAITGFRVVSSDGSTVVGSVMFDKPLTETEAPLKAAVVEKLSEAATDGIQVEFSQDMVRTTPSLVGPGEVIGLIVAAIVLFIMLGSIVAAGLPVLSALLGVAISAASSVALAAVVESTTTTPILGIMLGLAVGIDYALFIINRHRRQLKSGMAISDSIALANGTSGNSVAFAGLTVIIALAALNLTGIGFLGLMGSVGAMSIAIGVLVAVSFTPAILSSIGMRVLSRKERKQLTERQAHHEPAAITSDAPVFATKRPLISVVATVVALGILAIPFGSMRLGLPDGKFESTESTGYKSYVLTEDAFGEGANATLIAVATAPTEITKDNQLNYQANITSKLMKVENVVAVVPIGFSTDNSIAAFRVIPAEGPNSISTAQVVKDLRSLQPEISDEFDSKLEVTGLAAINLDVSQKLGEALPLYLATVIGLSLIVLILVFRSILLPIIASVGFLFTVFATFGAVVAVFQWGWLGFLFDIHDPGPILSFLPTLLIGILFGLAMDYQLFLASGMREAFVHGRKPTASINYGIHLSRSVVIAAAIIMVAVFGGFIFSHTTMVRPIGFGLAFGVLIDAFLVRLLLVPATLALLGEKAWWIPKWLDKILPDVDVEGAKLERSHPH